MINTEKIKHLPINLLSSLSSFGITFATFSIIQNNNILSFFIGLVVYLNIVITGSQIDYLNEQIENFKNKKDVEESIPFSFLGVLYIWGGGLIGGVTLSYFLLRIFS